jgi:HK97 family phage major capsid protein
MTAKKVKEPLKIEAMQRNLEVSDFQVRKSEDDKLITAISFSVSSEYAVQRWWGTEVLSHGPKAIRLDRIKNGSAPFLFAHDPNQPIGMITKASVVKGRLTAEASVFSDPDSQKRALQINEGMRNISVGYRVHAVEEPTDDDVFTVTDWEPYEISSVTLPADPTVGVGRGAGEVFEVRMINRASLDGPTPAAAAITRRVDTMSDEKAAAGQSAEENRAAAALATVEAARVAAAREVQAETEATRTAFKPNAVELEKERTVAIKNLCKANGFDDQLRDTWISSGMSIAKCSDEMLRIMEDRSKSKPQPLSLLGLSKDDTKRFSIVRAIQACADNNWSKAGFEAECSREIAQKQNKVPDPKKFFVPYEVQGRGIDGQAIARRDEMRGQAGRFASRADIVGTATAGGYLVETENVGFIELLRNRSVAYRMGARQLSGLVGNVTIPKQTGAAQVTWLSSETAQITEKEQVFGQLSLTPKTVGGYTEVSRQLLLQSSPDIEGIVNADLATITALAVDSGALNGPGTAGQPLGIVNVPGVGSAGSMTTLAYAGVLNFQVQVANANVMPIAGGYATTPTVAALLMARVRFANTATPLWDGNLWDANGENGVAGFPGMSSLQVPTGDIIFGDWAQLIIAEWGVLEIDVNPYANFQAGIIGVRSIMSLDVGLRYPAAFCVGTSVT